MLSQVAQAFRSWKNAQGVALLAVAALGVGIGSATAIYTIVDGVLLRPLPFAHAERYVALFAAQKGVEGWSGNSWLNLLEYQRRTTSFDSFGIYQPREFTLTAPGLPRHISAVEVTPTFIRNLGVPPLRGRWFQEAEREEGNLKLAVISSGLWRSLGEDPAIVGKTLTLDGGLYTVTGVAPEWFRFPVSGYTGAEVRAGYTEAAVDLAPGDVLIAFTDGVPEAQNPAEEEFGEDRVREALLRLADKDVDTIATEFAAELKAWIAGADQYDDLTCIVLKMK